MLREIHNTRQIEGENRRRWFHSSDMDLIVWLDVSGNPLNFELCFDKTGKELCLRWSPKHATFTLVDSGENEPGRYKSAPILRSSTNINIDALISQFLAASDLVPEPIGKWVLAAIKTIAPQ